MGLAEILLLVNSDLSTPLNEGGVKTVKSVQYGTVDLYGYGTQSATVEISEVNPDKTVILINQTRGDDTVFYGIRVTGKTKTSFTVQKWMGENYANYFRAGWQAVEFY